MKRYTLVFALLMAVLFCGIVLAQINQVTIPNGDQTGSLVVNLPDGVSLPVGFNSGGIFVFLIILFVQIIKSHPTIKDKLNQLFPGTKDAWIIVIAFAVGLISGEISLLLHKYFGIPTPITQNQLILSAFGFSSWAIGLHSIFIKGLWNGFISQYLPSNKDDNSTGTSLGNKSPIGFTVIVLLIGGCLYTQAPAQTYSTYGDATILSGQSHLVSTHTPNGENLTFKGITIWSSSSAQQVTISAASSWSVSSVMTVTVIDTTTLDASTTWSANSTQVITVSTSSWWANATTIYLMISDATSYSRATAIGKYIIPLTQVSTSQIIPGKGFTIYNDVLGLSEAECANGIMLYIVGAADVKYQVLWKNYKK